MVRTLLVNAPSAFNLYGNSKVRTAVPVLPCMPLAVLAGELRHHGHDVRILDLAVGRTSPTNLLRETLSSYRPGCVGVTSTTPIFHEAAAIAGTAREMLGEQVLLVAGGPHPQAVPEDCLENSVFDAIVLGEGEETLRELVEGRPYPEVQGICYRENGGFRRTRARPMQKDLDSFAMPAIDLFERDYYVCSRIISRQNPVAPIEMTRGCPFGCTFCNRARTKFRVKSVERTLDELRGLRRLGFREFHIIDDQFTSNMKHAKAVCEAMIRADLGMTWNLRTGLRVDTVDDEFMSLARRSGCYQMGCGFESGHQEGLDAVGKGIELEQSRRAVEMARRHGIEIVGFFMIGMPGETLEGMEATIAFAQSIRPTYAKCTIVVPFPGTALYAQYEREGRIKTRDWSRYNFHSPGEIYDHPHLSWKVLRRAYNRFHRRFYFRPTYIRERLREARRQHLLLRSAWYALRTFGPGGMLKVS
ncbi:MAG: radical SAM protein [Planctomycetes bacterium]|nr:radical SAM protein [Planctomycetota bacterium]